MSSILTNTSSMVALQTLKMVNRGMGDVQNQISTGLKVATAKDNAATWAIAQTMSSDVGGFKQISDSLATGSAAVGVARTAAETVTKLLNTMKQKIVAAQDPANDKAKLQVDIVNLRDQIATVVSGAQFNGLNMVNNANTVSVLSSLNRATGGGVTTSTIDVVGQDLSAGTAGTARAAFTGANFTAATGGDLLAFSMNSGSANVEQVTLSATSFVAGDRLEVIIGSSVASYTVTASDLAATTPEDVIAVKLKDAIDQLGVTGVVTDYNSGAAGVLDIGNNGTGAVDQTVTFRMVPVGSGGLSGLNQIDVTSAATAAIGLVESALGTAIDAAAALGASQSRIEIQSDFVGKLMDSINTGIGALVDADMEEASARLTALQTQQQLGIQSLSIANQAPQNILALFK